MSEYQEVVLGQMLDNEDVWHKAGLTSYHFTDPFPRMVFDTISVLIEDGSPANIVTVKGRMPDIDSARLAGLTSKAPSSAWEFYAGKVKEEAARHHLWRLAGEAKEKLEGDESTEAVLSYLEDGLVSIALHGKEDVRRLGAGLHDYVSLLEKRHKNPGSLPGITTGFETFDSLFGGFEAQKLYYIGARPAEGKSALLLNLVVNAARAGAKVGIISLESSEQEAYARIFSNIQGVENYKLRQGLFRVVDMARITEAASEVFDWPVWISDNPELTTGELKAVARKMVIAHHAEILFVDYLQYIREDDGTTGEGARREHIAAASRALKALARSLHVPVVCAVQLKRDADGRRPYLGDFGESSQVEKDADVAILIHHYQDQGDRTILIVAKNRDGATADVPVFFDKEHAKFIAGACNRSNNVL